MFNDYRTTTVIEKYDTNVASRVPPEAKAGRLVNGITSHNGKRGLHIFANGIYVKI